MNLRWHTELGYRVANPRIEAFLDDIEAVYRKHGLSISHEDRHGAFEIESGPDKLRLNLSWLRQGHDGTDLNF